MTLDPSQFVIPLIAAAGAGLMAWGAIKHRVDHIDKRMDGMPDVYVSKELHRETMKQIKENMSEMKENIKALMTRVLRDGN